MYYYSQFIEYYLLLMVTYLGRVFLLQLYIQVGILKCLLQRIMQ